MEIKELKNMLDKKYNTYKYEEDIFGIDLFIDCRTTGNIICVLFYKKEDKIYMSDLGYLIDKWAQEEDIVNFEPLKKVKDYAEKYGATFDKYSIDKELDVNGDIDYQIAEFSRVLLFADLTLSQYENK